MPIDWSHKAACLVEDPELFFPISPEGLGHAEAERAKVICRDCPVREPCLDYALSTGQAYGVWGGTDPSQRREIILASPRRESVGARRPRGGR
ncbi:WhiB family transcriptional regulator [Nonomuraea sp. NPDC049750]